MNAREEILARLRTALADDPEAQPVPRTYGISLAGGPGPTGGGPSTDPHTPELIDLFVDRLHDYKATVHRALGGALTGVSRLLVPVDVPPEWLDGFGGEVVVDHDLPVDVLDSVDAVLTGCAVAIAETGTIVLDAGPAQGRRAITLVPDRHIVVVRHDQIVGRVPEAIRRLAAAGAVPRPQTWISGPSATSDIELIRVEGVHGPRRLDVIIA